MKKKEALFIAIVLVLAVGLWGVLKLSKPDSYKSIRITVAGEEYGTYSLDEDQVIQIGETNVAEIKNHQIQMIDASCPDQICIYQGAIGDDGGMIVCLPNQVLIEAEAKEGSGIDSVTS